MSTIANRSHWPLGPAILAGAVLSAMCISSDSTLAQRNSPQADSSVAIANPHHHHWLQFGRASWYGRPFQGQATASGEIYDMNSMTCAHRSLPLGATVLVTNLRNHRSVLVRVNDRGPVPESRVVDLSYAAARILGFRGLAPVRIDLVDPSLSPTKIAELSWPAQFQR
jgi:rare lipoprotein A (peptidoglycan hydrolase)